MASGEGRGERGEGRALTPLTTGYQMLQINNIEVVYSDVILVLRGISLAVPDNQIVSLLGAN